MTDTRPVPAGAPIALPSDGIRAREAERIGQVTAVEQARAVAQVQAQVIVAQQVPRDQQRASAEMREACGRMTLAERAFYAVRNRGSGPSVHLARELARIWGNVEYGVHELRRDDAAGESEIQAFAWDIQTNTRSTRTFVVPHVRMKTVDGRQTRQSLVDLGDIYLNNQNIGARAVRECIFTVLPTAFVEEAQALCHATLKNGEGKPLDQRVADMLARFRELGVTEQQIEVRTGRKRGQWDAGVVAQMSTVYRSIDRGEITVDEAFPTAPVTAGEITESKPKRSTKPSSPPPDDDPDAADAAWVADAQGDPTP